MELRPRTLLKAGLWSIGIAWAPVVAIGLMEPTTHPVGLAVIAWAGTMLGLGLIAAAAAIAAARRFERRRQRRRRATAPAPPRPLDD